MGPSLIRVSPAVLTGINSQMKKTNILIPRSRKATCLMESLARRIKSTETAIAKHKEVKRSDTATITENKIAVITLTLGSSLCTIVFPVENVSSIILEDSNQYFVR